MAKMYITKKFLSEKGDEDAFVMARVSKDEEDSWVYANLVLGRADGYDDNNFRIHLSFSEASEGKEALAKIDVLMKVLEEFRGKFAAEVE